MRFAIGDAYEKVGGPRRERHPPAGAVESAQEHNLVGRAAPVDGNARERGGGRRQVAHQNLLTAEAATEDGSLALERDHAAVVGQRTGTAYEARARLVDARGLPGRVRDRRKKPACAREHVGSPSVLITTTPAESVASAAVMAVSIAPVSRCSPVFAPTPISRP